MDGISKTATMQLLNTLHLYILQGQSSRRRNGGVLLLNTLHLCILQGQSYFSEEWRSCLLLNTLHICILQGQSYSSEEWRSCLLLNTIDLYLLQGHCYSSKEWLSIIKYSRPILTPGPLLLIEGMDELSNNPTQHP